MSVRRKFWVPARPKIQLHKFHFRFRKNIHQPQIHYTSVTVILDNSSNFEIFVINAPCIQQHRVYFFVDLPAVKMNSSLGFTVRLLLLKTPLIWRIVQPLLCITVSADSKCGSHTALIFAVLELRMYLQCIKILLIFSRELLLWLHKAANPYAHKQEQSLHHWVRRENILRWSAVICFQPWAVNISTLFKAGSEVFMLYYS